MVQWNNAFSFFLLNECLFVVPGSEGLLANTDEVSEWSYHTEF